MRQECKMESLNICICELQRETHPQQQEMQELRRAQELRVDEFSSRRLRESHDTIQKLTSQIQELQEKVNCTSDSREFQDGESICSRKISHVPSHPAVIPSPRARSSRDRTLRPATWNSSGIHGNVFVHARCIFDPSHRVALHSLSQNSNKWNSGASKLTAT